MPRPVRSSARGDATGRGDAHGAVSRGDGPLRDRGQRGDGVRRRAPAGDHGQRVLVRVARARARHGRARPPAVHHADGAGRRSVRRQRARRRPAGALGLLRARAGQPGPRSVLRRAPGSRGRRGCRSSRAPSRRSSARSSRPSAPATTTCSSAGSIRSSRVARTSRRCSTTGAATCAWPRASTARSRASRRAECRRSGRTGWTSSTTSAAPARRWCCCTARHRWGSRTSRRSCRA